MDGTALFLISVTAYAALPLLYTLWRGPARFLLLYVHLAAVLTLGGILGAVYVLPLPGGVSLLAGQVSYGAFIFATLVTVVVGRDVQVVRNIVVLTLGVNVLVATIFALSHQALVSDAGIPNPLGTPVELFAQSTRVVVSGGLLIIAELLLLIALLEVAKRRLPSWAMAPYYVLAYVGIIVLDGVLFPTLVLMPPTDLAGAIASSVHAKVYLAGAFTVPLVVFVAAYRPTLTRYEASPVRLRALLSVTRDELLDRYDRQQAEIDQQRARLTHSAASAGRAAATTSGLLRSAQNSLLITTDESLTITRVSSGAARILDLPEHELVGRTLDSLHSPEVWARIAAEVGVPNAEAEDPFVVAGAVAESRVRRDWDFLTGDGSTRTVSYSLTEIVDEGEVVGYLGAGEDVTDRVRTEHAMSAALQREHDAVLRLQEVDQLKADLVSNVSHELRTPITSVSGYLEMVTDGQYGEITPPQRAVLGRIAENANRLERLVDDLLTLGASEAGTLVLDLDEVDLCDVVVSLRDLMEEMCRGRDVELQVAPTGGPIPLRADPAALERVIVNLVTNAIKFTEGAGSVRVEVHPDVAINGHHAGGVLVVHDTGIGISAEAQQKLFTRFYRAPEAAARAIPGSGLGLSIVHSIVTAHHGAVSLDSTPGVGTTVTVRLPADPTDQVLQADQVDQADRTDAEASPLTHR